LPQPRLRIELVSSANLHKFATKMSLSRRKEPGTISDYMQE